MRVEIYQACYVSLEGYKLRFISNRVWHKFLPVRLSSGAHTEINYRWTFD